MTQNLKAVNVFPKEANLLAFTIDNVFSKEECEEWIAHTEKIGYEKALVNVGNGQQRLMTDIRNNDRCIIDSEEMADKIYQRVKQFIPDTFHFKDKVSLNERLRFLRYKPDQKFEAHYDGSYVRESGPKKGERSYITLQLYLNEGAKGGETTFFVQRKEYSVTPKTGMVVIFQHNILHEGAEVQKGLKYVVRTDVMYSA
ncbi:hypothetical protein CYY_004357 [Polysphondylium violaceum]|uniref:Fe2OG dioxygenase domain-containing protein n=1 Tax=Polysphondylium violaceum TaxID=133409 RepID=A0A8J4Q5I3_9MYCE|nr:hypothetical protein CYY_004357 [Polysphondylium violaceum]